MTVVKSNYKPQENQFYETPEWATEALLRSLGGNVSGVIWEPAAGKHKLARVLDSYRWSSRIITSDIKDYGVKHDFMFDFINGEMEAYPNVDWIITNPPYGAGNRMAEKFIRRALKLAPNVAMLLTAKFDFGKSRKDMFQNNPNFATKVTLTDRLSFFRGKTGTEDHAWYVWSDGYPLPYPQIRYDGNE